MPGKKWRLSQTLMLSLDFPMLSRGDSNIVLLQVEKNPALFCGGVGRHATANTRGCLEAGGWISDPLEWGFASSHGGGWDGVWGVGRDMQPCLGSLRLLACSLGLAHPEMPPQAGSPGLA